MFGHGDKAIVLRAVMEAPRALALQPLQRGPLQHTKRQLLCRREYGRLRLWASGPGERLLAVLLLALLAQVAVPAWPLVVEFLMVLGVWHLQFWEVRIAEQSCHVEDDGFAVFSYLVRCIILPWRRVRLWKLPPSTVSAT